MQTVTATRYAFGLTQARSTTFSVNKSMHKLNHFRCFHSTSYQYCVLNSLTEIRSGLASRDILMHAWETVSLA